jgi:predicted XRE-type DNA-binding protein
MLPAQVTGDGLSHPAFMQARRLDQSESVVRELLALHFGVGVGEAGRVEVVPVLEAALADAVSQTRSTREEAERLRVDAIYLTRQTARRLKAEGLPQRDISVLLGVSHQAVSQMLAG